MTDKRRSWLHIVQSVLASAFGVQSKQKHLSDFTGSQSVVPYLITGVIFVILLILTLILTVNWVIA